MRLYLFFLETLKVTIYGSKETSCWSIFFKKKLICNFSFVLMVFVNVNVNYLIGEDEN